MTLGSWLDAWLSVYVRPSVRLRTFQMYRRAAAALPGTLAAADLDSVQVLDLAKWLREVERDHPRAAQLDRIMLTRSLRQAFACRVMSWQLDPEALPRITHKAKRTKTLTAEQMRRYMNEGGRIGGDAWPALLLCCCGLRRGEALGVRRDDITPEGVLHVQRQRYADESGKLTEQPLKTAAGDRYIRLPQMVLRAIRSAPVTLSGYLVDISPRTMYNCHSAILTALQLPHVTIHGLRHSMATISAADGIPPSVLMQELGHGDVAVTLGLYANHLQSDVMPLDASLYGA